MGPLSDIHVLLASGLSAVFVQFHDMSLFVFRFTNTSRLGAHSGKKSNGAPISAKGFTCTQRCVYGPKNKKMKRICRVVCYRPKAEVQKRVFEHIFGVVYVAI